MADLPLWSMESAKTNSIRSASGLRSLRMFTGRNPSTSVAGLFKGLTLTPVKVKNPYGRLAASAHFQTSLILWLSPVKRSERDSTNGHHAGFPPGAWRGVLNYNCRTMHCALR